MLTLQLRLDNPISSMSVVTDSVNVCYCDLAIADSLVNF